MALLIYEQKVTIKYGGMTIQPNDPKLPDMLRKKSEVGKTEITKRHVVSPTKMKEAREFLRDFLDVMDVPADEDGLISFIIEKFSDLEHHYDSLNQKYEGRKYPDQKLVWDAVRLVKDVLSQKSDNIALIDKVISSEDALYAMQDKLKNIESFFKTQVSLFDSAANFVESMKNDLDYIESDEEANHALNQMRLITTIFDGKTYDYSRIPELNDLMTIVKTSHDAMLDEKREELLEVVRQCMAEIHQAVGGGSPEARAVSEKADVYYTQQKEKIAETESLALMEGFPIPMWNYRDDSVSKIDFAKQPPVAPPKPPVNSPVKKTYKPIFRQSLMKAARLESDDEIDAYVDKLRDQLKTLLKGVDGIELK